MTDCMMCQKRVKNWSGDDPKCSFPDGGRFTNSGWNCATANAIRDICSEGVGCGDQYYSCLKIDDIDLGALSLWVSWYKRRGRTDAMWLLSDEGEPVPPTESQALAIIAAHFKRVKRAAPTPPYPKE